MVEDPGCYLLKLVQAAVAGQATRVDVRLLRNRVEVAFDSPLTAGVRPQKVAEALDRSEVEDEVLGEVLEGLRAARILGPGEVTWSTCDGQRMEKLHLSRTSLRLGASGPSREMGCRFLLERPWQPSRLAGSIAERASEHRLAYTRCRFSPVAVTLDGRAINDPLLDALVADGCLDSILAADYPREWLLAERYLVPRFYGPDLLTAPGPHCRRSRVFRLSAENTRIAPISRFRYQGLLYEALRVWEFPGSPPEPTEKTHLASLRFQLPTDPQEQDARPLACVAALGIPLALEGASRVVPIRNGVALDMRRADLGCPGAVAVISARGLTVEPGTLRVVEDAAWEEHLAFLRGELQPMLSGLRAHLHLLEPTDPQLVQYVRRKLG
jgi:hypothetical protein